MSGIERIQTSLHLAMGVVYLIMGSVVIYIKAFGTLDLPTNFAYVLGGLMIAYGAFRLWRGAMNIQQKKQRATRI